MNQALLIIDIQNDYFPGGHMELVGMEKAAANSQALLKKFRSQGLLVFHVQHLSPRANAHFFILISLTNVLKDLSFDVT